MAKNIIIKIDEEIVEVKGSEFYKGEKGDIGWLPLIESEVDGKRILHKLVGYAGGTGDIPTINIGRYFSPTGMTNNKEEATNYRGERGITGDVESAVGDKRYNDLIL